MQHQKMVIAQGTDASTMDPYAHSETTTSNILLQVYDALVRRNADMEIEPWLATRWEIISETVIQFDLRNDVRFHNGEPFNAEAVRFSLERMIDPNREPKFPPYGRFNSIEQVEVISDDQVRVHTNRPDPNLLAQLAGLMIISPQYIQEKGEDYFARVPNGTGPFRFVEWDREQKRVQLKANESYWGGQQSVQTLIFQAVPESEDRIAGLLNGTIDLAANFPPLEKEKVEASENVEVLGTPSVGIIYMGINTKHPVLKNKKLRQAMAHAIDVQALVDQELNHCGSPLAGPVYPEAFGVDPTIDPIPYNPQRAKKLLREAGFENGVRVKLEVPDGRFTQDKQIALRIKEQLSQVGIDLEVDIQPWEPFIRRFRDHKYDQMYYVGWGNFTFDPDEVYRNAFISPNNWNPTDFHHDGLADRVITASQTLDQEERKRLYREALLIFREELPWIPLFQQYDLYGMNTQFRWKPRMDEFIYVCDVE